MRGRGMALLAWCLAGLTLALGAGAAWADPENDRLRLEAFFRKQFPDLQAEQYVHGAMLFDPEAMAQYRSIMEFPPFAGEVEKGEVLWRATLQSGLTYADCLPNGGRMIAGNYPMFDEAKGRVMTLEDAINACRVANNEVPYQHGDPATMGALTAYLRGLSDGMKMNIRVESEAARRAFEDGKKTFYARAGQLNFSCASCHVDNAGNRLRGDILSPAIGQATHWPVFRGGDQLLTLQARYASCHRLARHVPDALGSTRYNNLEYFHSYLSNGLPLRASVFRK